MNQNLPISVHGHVKIVDDLGNVHLDQDNAVHPQNMARVIARALSHENNSWITSVAFGNGGTVANAAYQLTYKTPNDGQTPDTAEWRSRLYNETYREIVDDQNSLIGTGTGSVVADDPPHVANVSGPGVRSYDNGLTSTVRVEVVLNPEEPKGQFTTDTGTNTESSFMFDEIGLFTSGAPLTATAGYDTVTFAADHTASDDTGLTPNTQYYYHAVVDGGAVQTHTITTPAVGSGTGGAVTFGDLAALINASGLTGALASITGYPNSTTQTYGELRVSSTTVGASSAVVLPLPTASGMTPPAGLTAANWLFSKIVGYSSISIPVSGSASGVQNDPVNSGNEAERMLTHIIFSPVQKSQNRTFTIVYTLTVTVARSST